MPSLRALGMLACAVLSAACSVLPAPPAETPTIHLLEAQLASGAGGPKPDLVLAVAAPRAWPGFDTSQMAYMRRPQELEYFARNRWADAPSRMLGPVVARALAAEGRFSAVVLLPAQVSADLRLDTEIVRLVQDFGTSPSRVQLTLRAQVVDLRSKRVVATQEFSESEPAASEDAAGGAGAANRALGRMLRRLADFCAEASASR